MIERIKNVTAPREVFLWESSADPSAAVAAPAQTAAQDEGNTAANWPAALLKAAEDWMSGKANTPWPTAIYEDEAPMETESVVQMPPGNHAAAGHDVLGAATAAPFAASAAGHHVLDDSASRDGPADRGSVAAEVIVPPPQSQGGPAARGNVAAELHVLPPLPRPPTHTPEEEMAARLQAFADATAAKLAHSNMNEKLCNLCAKQISEGHLKSAAHREKLKESALLDHLADTVENIRMLTPCERKLVLTYPGQPLTRKRCREVWGHLLD
jgi:hypothetical protein